MEVLTNHGTRTLLSIRYGVRYLIFLYLKIKVLSVATNGIRISGFSPRSGGDD